ncbi:chain-length determining protein [Colwellia sp. 75C3]|uniref:GumC family protein n=1 Tax=Colwellia sp. 75C3 TaxID=888425 RepID=UPI000C331950|nr:polysaccharide biosynthesis tyrosine autokinase [Colwellia sp. 75C3]PKG82536.1 chain-length determining protein [Colwellia sp. 75C3]
MELDSKAKVQEEVIDLRQYFAILNKYKFKVFFFALFIAIFAGIVAMKMTPVYKATATLLIEAEQAQAVNFQEVMGLDSGRKEYYLTQFEILKSQAIAKKVIKKLNLIEQPEFNKPPSALARFKIFVKESLPFLPKNSVITLSESDLAEQEVQRFVKVFSSRLSISPIRKTQLVSISFEAEDPKLAAAVANAVGEVYIENHMTAKMGVTQKAAGWLNERLSDLRIGLDESEDQLQAYREQENLIDVQGVVGLVTKELEQTAQQLVIARNERNQLQSIMRVINEYGRNDLERLGSITAITSHNVIQDVKKEVVSAERRVSELSQVYGIKHPKMIAVKAELATVSRNLSKQVYSLVNGIEKEVKTSQANVIALQQELSLIREQYQLITGKENEYRKLKREVQTNRNLFDTFLSRSKETEITSDFNAVVARFTDRAFTPIEPIKPIKSLIVALAFVASFGFAVVLAFVIEALNDTFKSSADIENKLSQRMLGLLPLVVLNKNEQLNQHYFFEEGARKFAESVRTLRTSFVLTQLDKGSKVIEITSTVPGEGKTTTSTNLAFSLAQVEKTILIDADMRKPSICKRFNIPPYHPGLSNLIAGTEQFDDCIYYDDKSGLTVMPCGQIPSNPLELLLSPRFAEVLAQLKESYDRIIIDTPPVQAVSDSLVIAQQADAVIYVVKSDDTRIGAVQDSMGRLINLNANIAGVVLSQVDTRKVASHDYYHGYYTDYTYGNEKES